MTKRKKQWKSTHNRIGRCRGHLHAIADMVVALRCDGRVMKVQKTATKTQIYFQQKRKCKINKTQLVSPEAQQRQCQSYTSCSYRQPEW